MPTILQGKHKYNMIRKTAISC